MPSKKPRSVYDDILASVHAEPTSLFADQDKPNEWLPVYEHVECEVQEALFEMLVGEHGAAYAEDIFHNFVKSLRLHLSNQVVLSGPYGRRSE